MFLALCTATLLASFSSCWGLNDRPIIGVLAQETWFRHSNRTFFSNGSYIAASYVKYLESAGARVVPIFINQPPQYYVDIINFTNGILFPGGGQLFNKSDSGYGNAGKILYKLAIQANDRGDYYPVWGTCLGFELLTYLSSDLGWWLSTCNSVDQALPLEFVTGFRSSRLMENMPCDVKYYLSTLPVTANYHTACITPKDFQKASLDKFYKVLSTNVDSNNITFVSTIEAVSYPIYGTAWHPEKNPFEFALKNKLYNIPHSYEAIRVSQHFANFFVNEARKSNHKFPSALKEQKALIYNYDPVYTSPTGSSFEQCYYFK